MLKEAGGWNHRDLTSERCLPGSGSRKRVFFILPPASLLSIPAVKGLSWGSKLAGSLRNVLCRFLALAL